MATLVRVSTGATINASDVDQIISELQHQTGETETGEYVLAGGSNASGFVVSAWVSMRSRVSTPASVTIDTSIQAPSGNANTPSTNHLLESGFQVFFTTSAGNVSNGCAGLWTVHF